MYECSETEHDTQNNGILDRIQDERGEWIVDGAMGAQFAVSLNVRLEFLFTNVTVLFLVIKTFKLVLSLECFEILQ